MTTVSGSVLGGLRTALAAAAFAAAGAARSAEPPVYDLQGVLELTGECTSDNCLLAPFLSVAMFADRRREGRQVAILLDDYFYCHDSSREVYRVPAGFETDFLSIPELAQNVIRPKDFMEAAVIHDWLYAVGEAEKREHADRVFSDVLAEQGAPYAKRQIMFRAVRMGGDAAYGAEREWRFVDLETMQEMSPPPLTRPSRAAIADIDCADEAAFDRLRRGGGLGYSFEPQIDEFFETSGFLRVTRGR